MLFSLRISAQPWIKIALVATWYILLPSWQSARAEARLLAWKPNGTLGIAGYRVSIQGSDESKARVIDVGNERSITFNDLLPETKYVASVTAYNTVGLVSPPSNEVSFVTAPASLTVTPVQNGNDISITGKPGQVIDLYQSLDMHTWKLVSSLVNITGSIHLEGFQSPAGDGPVFYKLESRGDSFDAWMASHGMTDPLGDDDHDAISNYQAFASGADLFPSSRDALPSVGTVTRSSGGVDRLFASFTYTFRDHNADFGSVAESSTDGHTWRDALDHMVLDRTVLNGNGTRSVTLREATPVDSGPANKRLFRIRYVRLGETFSDWAFLKGIYDPLADPEHDGLDHFTEFATGADLLTNRAAVGPVIGTALFPTGGRDARYATLTYTKRASAFAVGETIESSTDLRTWNIATHSMIPVSNVLRANGTRVITLRESSPVSTTGSTRRYYRIRRHSLEPWATSTLYQP